VVDKSKAIPLVLAPGDVAIFGCFTPHGSEPNRSERCRTSAGSSRAAIHAPRPSPSGSRRGSPCRRSAGAASWAASHVRFEEWARLVKADRKVRAAGLAWFASALASGELDPKNAYVELETAFAEACWKKAIAADPELAALDGDRHGELVAQFVEIEERSRAAAVGSVRARHQAAIPRGALGEMRVIRGEIGRKRAHMPLRKLMKAAGGTIQKIKPVFLMSPVSVAQFLPPGSVDFDLLVIDEASQLRPEDAFGLVARCRRMVVVGDKKQLPPAGFFDRTVVFEEKKVGLLMKYVCRA
jgi:hypothetical protein